MSISDKVPFSQAEALLDDPEAWEQAGAKPDTWANDDEEMLYTANWDKLDGTQQRDLLSKLKKKKVQDRRHALVTYLKIRFAKSTGPTQGLSIEQTNELLKGIINEIVLFARQDKKFNEANLVALMNSFKLTPDAINSLREKGCLDLFAPKQTRKPDPSEASYHTVEGEELLGTGENQVLNYIAKAYTQTIPKSGVRMSGSEAKQMFAGLPLRINHFHGDGGIELDSGPEWLQQLYHTSVKAILISSLLSMAPADVDLASCAVPISESLVQRWSAIYLAAVCRSLDMSLQDVRGAPKLCVRFDRNAGAQGNFVGHSDLVASQSANETVVALIVNELKVVISPQDYIQLALSEFGFLARKYNRIILDEKELQVKPCLIRGLLTNLFLVKRSAIVSARGYAVDTDFYVDETVKNWFDMTLPDKVVARNLHQLIYSFYKHASLGKDLNYFPVLSKQDDKQIPRQGLDRAAKRKTHKT